MSVDRCSMIAERPMREAATKKLRDVESASGAALLVTQRLGSMIETCVTEMPPLKQTSTSVPGRRWR